MCCGASLLLPVVAKKQQRHEYREHHAAGLGVEGVFHQHGENQQQNEGDIDESDAFFHLHERINEQKTEIEELFGRI